MNLFASQITQRVNSCLDSDFPFYNLIEETSDKPDIPETPLLPTWSTWNGAQRTGTSRMLL